MPESSKTTIAPNVLKSAAARVAERCDALAKFSDSDKELTRTFCSPAMKRAYDQLQTWMISSGMECSLDSAGNLIGKFARSRNKLQNNFQHVTPSQLDQAEIFMIGSHLDTVVNAGRFDGTLGVLLGLGVVEILAESKTSLPFEVHIVAFSEEEGVRFRFPFIGSQGIAGTFDKANLDRLDENEVTMRQALEEFGCQANEIESASYQGKPVIGFMEAHIEQATLLEEENLPVGVVSSIAGQTRATISLFGQAGHAGTVPHNRRRDAIAAAAELVLKIEQIGRSTDGLFATVGSLVASPGLSNVISGSAELRLDLRHESDSQREVAFQRIGEAIKEIELSRSVVAVLDPIEHSPAVPMDETLTSQLRSAITELGLEAKTMVSGAGHDAMVMAQLAPSCMLFVRCRDGLSHNPAEFVAPEDIQSALNIMVTALIKMTSSK
ncbi:MAG: allantoate amidohydrolase [Mariniblastus sp.]